ncbi:hypothetical protein EDB92DRAFT_1947585 [Lactarius akahatsu]|uniref:Uncharacterized protein n=1 Tax=Lactarius akahatsu TaxID=416441 RepID=A0AAD4Q9T0_9AGAM|nr:hypothetical protein EDB92DRAFT_1947585 [Lactarius akahatsu]
MAAVHRESRHLYQRLNSSSVSWCNSQNPLRPIPDLSIVGGDKQKVGYYIGMPMSLHRSAEAVTVLQWSRCSDHIGRNHILLLGLASSVTASYRDRKFTGQVDPRTLSESNPYISCCAPPPLPLDPLLTRPGPGVGIQLQLRDAGGLVLNSASIGL